MTHNQQDKNRNRSTAVYAVVVNGGIVIGKSMTPRKATKRHFEAKAYRKFEGLKEVIVWFGSRAEADRVLSDALVLMRNVDVKRTGDNQSPQMDVSLKMAKMFIEQAYVKAGMRPMREYDVFRKRGFRKSRKAMDLSQYKGIE